MSKIFERENRSNTIHGILFVMLFSCAAFYISDTSVMKYLSFSPLIIGVVLGMLYGNTLRSGMPAEWGAGIVFCSKKILRLGIILYGFKLTFQNVVEVGVGAIWIDVIVIIGTLLLGLLVGKLLKMDRDLSLLTATGSAICGAAAILGAEPVLKTQPYKTAIAVSTVVVLGTLSMFLYPIVYRSGMLDLSPQQWGVYTGSTIHEVAHVVGAGNAMTDDISSVAIIVKMIRVMLLAPVLLIFAFFMSRSPSNRADGTAATKTKISIPWFAFGFIAVIAFNSLDLLPVAVVEAINYIDTFMLTMAMTALGMETSFKQFKQAGAKPFVLALVLYAWLLVGGYLLVKYLYPILS